VTALEPAVDTSTYVPGAQPPQRFVAFGAPVAKGEYAAFVGEGELALLGVYCLHVPTGQLWAVADSRTLLPGGGGFFGGFPYVPSVSADGDVLFYSNAWGDGQRSGFYLSGPATSHSLAAVTTMGSASLAYMIMLSSGFVGVAPAHGCMAFYAIRTARDGTEEDVLLAMRPTPYVPVR